MTDRREAFFMRDSRELREKRERSETSSFRVALVAHVARLALVSCERRDTRYERRGFSRWGG
jgi:hypothetical protein